MSNKRRNAGDNRYARYSNGMSWDEAIAKYGKPETEEEKKKREEKSRQRYLLICIASYFFDLVCLSGIVLYFTKLYVPAMICSALLTIYKCLDGMIFLDKFFFEKDVLIEIGVIAVIGVIVALIAKIRILPCIAVAICIEHALFFISTLFSIESRKIAISLSDAFVLLLAVSFVTSGLVFIPKIQERNDKIRRIDSGVVYCVKGSDKYHLYAECSNMANPFESTEQRMKQGRERCSKCYKGVENYYPKIKVVPTGSTQSGTAEQTYYIPPENWYELIYGTPAPIAYPTLTNAGN